jgi:hypothetical protein
MIYADLLLDLDERAENDPYHGYLHRRAADAIRCLQAACAAAEQVRADAISSMRERESRMRSDEDATIAVSSLHTIASAHTVASSYKDAAKDAVAAFERLRADRDEWRTQHENLLSVRQSDLQIVVQLRAELAHEQTRAEKAEAELQNIADARPQDWQADVRDQFQEWAQSRARACIAARKS